MMHLLTLSGNSSLGNFDNKIISKQHVADAINVRKGSILLLINDNHNILLIF